MALTRVQRHTKSWNPTSNSEDMSIRSFKWIVPRRILSRTLRCGAHMSPVSWKRKEKREKQTKRKEKKLYTSGPNGATPPQFTNTRTWQRASEINGRGRRAPCTVLVGRIRGEIEEAEVGLSSVGEDRLWRQVWAPFGCELSTEEAKTSAGGPLCSVLGR